MKYVLPLLLILIVVFGYLYYQKMEQRYEELQANYVQAREEYVQKVSELQKKIETLQAVIQEREEDVKKKERRIADLDKQLQHLETQPVEETAQEQLLIWKQKFSLCEQIVADKDAIIFSLTQKYEAQVRITSATEELLSQTQLRLIEAEQRLKKRDRTRKIFTGALIVTSAILILKEVLK